MERAQAEGRADLMIEMRGVTKRFGPLAANDRVDFELRPGEIHALLGENGAGKSTLMNVLYGLYSADAGDIFKQGSRVSFRSPAQAIRQRIGMIHQHFMLIPPLTVVENVALCLREGSRLRLDLAAVEARLLDLSRRYGLSVDPRARVEQLSVGERQRVEILKVLYRGADVLIMDEPTAVLTPNEVTELFAVLREIARQGSSVIFISHKLWEVMSISDRVTVLRDGCRIGTLDTSSTTKEGLARMMVGREFSTQHDRPAMPPGEDILALDDVRCTDDRGLPALNGVTLRVRAGEIVGIAGVDGNGQKELAELVHGLRRAESGTISFAGARIRHPRPADMLARGLAHIPEDRHSTGIVMDFTVAENLVMIGHDRPPFTRHGLRRPRAVSRHADESIGRFDIRCSGAQTLIRHLSGGNQQKVVIARELSRGPRLILAAQPSRGLDIGATDFVHRQLLDERAKGKGVLLVSTDLDEVLAVADRVLVMYKGAIVKEFVPGQASLEEIGLAMAGL